MVTSSVQNLVQIWVITFWLMQKLQVASYKTDKRIIVIGSVKGAK